MSLKLEDLLGEESSYTSLSPKEREYFCQLIKEEMAHRAELEEVRQIRDIVPIEQWINSSYYLGPDCDKIYPYWKDVIIDIFREDRKPEEVINSVILSGSIGTGKSTTAEIITLRKLYELSCYKNINSLFHLMSKTSIMFLYFSVNKQQAVATGFGEIRAWIDSSTYFRENFPRRSRLNDILVFPEGLTIAYGSGLHDSIGKTILLSILDEANFIGGNGKTGAGNTEKANAIYSSLINRGNSRFITDGGVNNSLNILISSSTTMNSTTETQIAASRDDPHTYICSPAQWEVKPNNFSKKFFYVCKGTNYLEPHIIRSTDDINNFRISEGLPKEKFIDGIEEFDKIDEEIQKLPPHQQLKFLKVPVDLKKGFETNIIQSLQDLGGVSTGAEGKLFNSVAVYNGCIVDYLTHPFVSNELIISTGDKIQIKDYLKNSFRLRHPERPRFIHIDQSYRTDSTGIASVYIEDVIEDEDGVKKPVFATDFIIRINPPKPPKKIAIYKIRNFVVWLGTSFGMKIGKVTYDIFNSEESRQILEEMGFNVGYQSVDKTDKAYLDLVEIMYEGRFKTYDYPIFRYELFNLVHYRDKRKVDHLKTIAVDQSLGAGSGEAYAGKGTGIGSKDSSDAVAGAVFNALQFSISDSSGNEGSIEDFMEANRLNSAWEPDSMTADQMIDKILDDYIDEIDALGMGGFGWM